MLKPALRELGVEGCGVTISIQLSPLHDPSMLNGSPVYASAL